MSHFRNEQGQALILMLLFLGVLMALSAAVLDVGAWYRADRKLQATADAAALAGAHGLPDNQAEAMGLALEYGDKNEGGVASSGVSFETSVNPGDTIRVHAEKPVPGFFSRVFGIDSVDVGATAKARTAPMSSAKWAAPVAVDERHPLLHCTPVESCFGSGNPTTLDFFKVGPGAFRLINIDQSHGGTGPQTVGDWIEHGLDQYMPLDWYFSDSGIKPNSSNVTDAFDKRIGTELLFPVYRATRAQGSNFEYEVVGWVGFHLTGYDIQGSKDSRLYGWFTEIIWEGIQSESASDPDFGARAISLVE
jgi:Putative Flp pilus-assembly TadE/G-like